MPLPPPPTLPQMSNGPPLSLLVDPWVYHLENCLSPPVALTLK